MSNLENLYLECDCSSNEHTLKVTCDIDDERPEQLSSVYVHVQLSHQRWYRRIWPAVRYVFGYECKYGHWDETILNMEQVGKLHMFLHAFGAEVLAKTKTSQDASKAKLDKQ